MGGAGNGRRKRDGEVRRRGEIIWEGRMARRCDVMRSAQVAGGKTPETFLLNHHKRAWLILVDGKTPIIVQPNGSTLVRAIERD